MAETKKDAKKVEGAKEQQTAPSKNNQINLETLHKDLQRLDAKLNNLIDLLNSHHQDAVDQIAHPTNADAVHEIFNLIEESKFEYDSGLANGLQLDHNTPFFWEWDQGASNWDFHARYAFLNEGQYHWYSHTIYANITLKLWGNCVEMEKVIGTRLTADHEIEEPEVLEKVVWGRLNVQAFEVLMETSGEFKLPHKNYSNQN